MMDTLFSNNIPSDSNAEILENGDGETENDDFDKLSCLP